MKQETINSREEALKVITKALKNEYSIDKELEVFHKKSSNYEFKGFVNEIVQGTVKRLLEIDEYISLLITSKLNKLPEMILNILRISVYQLLYMKSVPQSAVINEAVNLAKRYGHKGTANLTNAVLRNLLRKQTELETKINNYPLKKRVSIKASIPIWIVDYWSLLINENELEEILLKTLEKPDFYLRINTLKINLKKIIFLLMKLNLMI